MAFGANTIFDVRTGGADTNGGGFDPGATLALTDLAATLGTGNSPVVTSASYNFVAGDVGAWVFIKSGTNWTPGWYQIASVSSNAATLSAAVGAAYTYTTRGPFAVNTVAGCATTATPSSGTASVDYSQQNSAAATGTASNSTTTLTATTAIFHKGMVGNFITNGTNWVEITGYTSTTVVTIAYASDPSWTSQSIKIGGGLASPGKAGGLKVAGNDVFIAAGTYTLGSGTANVATGVILDTTGGVDASNASWWCGYNTNRFKGNSDSTRPLIQVSGQSSVSVMTFSSGQDAIFWNIAIDGAGATGIIGFDCQPNSGGMTVSYCKTSNCKTGFNVNGGNTFLTKCQATTFATVGFVSGTGGSGSIFYGCVANGGSASGFDTYGATCVRCLSYENSGASSDGFFTSSASSIAGSWYSCSARHNGRHGFNIGNSFARNYLLVNCVAAQNGGYGFTATAAMDLVVLMNCAGDTNTSGPYNTTNLTAVFGFITLSGDPFTSSSDLSLISTGAGAQCRATGILGAFPDGTTTGFADAGAVQHQDSAQIITKVNYDMFNSFIKSIRID